MPAVRSRHRNGPVTTLAVAVATGAAVLASIGTIEPVRGPHTVTVESTAKIADGSAVIALADSDIYGQSAADVGKTLDRATASGLRVVRIFIPWAGVQPTSSDKYDWSNVDKLVDAAASRNMQVLGAINTTPKWAAAPGVPAISGKPNSPAVYADFVGKVASRYKGKVSAYEVWNEPNGIKFFSPVDPAAYTALLKAAYPKLKAVDPSITVVSAGLSALVDWGSSAMNPVKFLNGMYAAGAKGNFDALAFHPYQYTAKFSDGVPLENSPVNQVMDIREIMVANGDANKKIWGTEYGEPAPGIGNESKQSAFVKDVVTKWRELPYAGPLFIYTTRDRRTGSFTNEDNFGIYRTNWTAKPAQQEVSSAIAAGADARSPEFQRFSKVTTPAHGTIMSPVYPASSTVWAQIRTVDTLFEIAPGKIVASPNPIAEKVRATSKSALPIADFANGYQDFNGASALRVWYSPATGAHSAGAAIVKAWTPALGLATSDEVRGGLGSKTTFEHGTITWAPFVGAKVTQT